MEWISFELLLTLDEAAALTCMAYVDLNPIRAGVAQSLPESDHTGIQSRLNRLSDDELHQSVKAIAGSVKSRTMVIQLKDYIELVEWTGKSIAYPDKAKLPINLCTTLNHMNLKHDNWLNQVQGYGSHYHRFVGSMERIKQKTEALKLKWLKGVKQIHQLYLPDI